MAVQELAIITIMKLRVYNNYNCDYNSNDDNDDNNSDDNNNARRGGTLSARSGPRRTSGDSLPAARSPSIWCQWLQKSTDATVMPTSADAAHTAGGTAAPAAAAPACAGRGAVRG